MDLFIHVNIENVQVIIPLQFMFYDMKARAWFFQKRVKQGWKREKKTEKGGESTQKHTRNEEIFCHFWKVHSPTYDYCMHERPE